MLHLMCSSPKSLWIVIFVLVYAKRKHIPVLPYRQLLLHTHFGIRNRSQQSLHIYMFFFSLLKYVTAERMLANVRTHYLPSMCTGELSKWTKNDSIPKRSETKMKWRRVATVRWLKMIFFWYFDVWLAFKLFACLIYINFRRFPLIKCNNLTYGCVVWSAMVQCNVMVSGDLTTGNDRYMKFRQIAIIIYFRPDHWINSLRTSWKRIFGEKSFIKPGSSFSKSWIYYFHNLQQSISQLLFVNSFAFASFSVRWNKNAETHLLIGDV